MGNTVNIKINNIEVTAKKGQTILEAARDAGIHIPTLCYLKDINEIEYYLDLANKLCLTKRELKTKIRSNEYNRLPQETKEKLKNSNLNFVGNVEAREVPIDAADVIVTDGFTGNVMLKLYEGVATVLMGKIKNVLTQNIKNKIAATMILPEMRALKAEIDYNEYGGAPIMGLQKPVFKAHGSSSARTFKNAIRLTIDYVNGNVAEEISKALSEFEKESEA